MCKKRCSTGAVAIRREQHLERESRQSCDRISPDQQSVRRAVELDGGADLGLDDRRRSDDFNRIRPRRATRLSRRQVVTTGADCAADHHAEAPGRRPRASCHFDESSALIRMPMLRTYGVDRNAHQLGIRIWRRVGVVADIASARSRRAAAPFEPSLFVRMAVVAKRRQPVSLRIRDRQRPSRHHRSDPACSSLASGTFPAPSLSGEVLITSAGGVLRAASSHCLRKPATSMLRNEL